jgi:peptidoglycan/xylan/chitin deacetylase (PgdA/CDA1 family)
VEPEVPPIVNAMSIDVEDYFHANALSRLSPSTAWEGFEQRAERNTHRMLDVLDEHGVKATCFVLGWSPSVSSIVRRSSPTGTSWPRTATGTS